MAKRLQHRGGTTAQHSSFTGAVREVTVDTDKNTLVVHDGATAGGKPLPTLTGTETLSNKTLASPTFSGTATNFTSTGIDDNATSTAITIDSSEVVRIGNTSDIYSPTYTEHMVIGNYNADEDHGITFLSDLDNTFTLGFADDGHSTLRGAIKYSHLNDFMTFHAFADGERMRITSSGNVGIGTTSPAHKISIGTYTATSTATPDTISLGATYSSTAGQNLKLRLFYNNATLSHGFGISNGQMDYVVSGAVSHVWYSSGTERMRIDTSGNLKFNSGYGSAATAYGCRAWVNFNGTGTVAIREDGNVTSITDNGTGLYTVNFTTAMPDTNYAVACSGSRDDTNNVGMALVNTRSGTASYNPYATTSIAISSLYAHTSAVDSDFITVTIFR